MSPIAFIALVAAGLMLLVVMIQRERAAQFRARSRFLADCRSLFDQVIESEGADGFPQLEGLIAGKRVQVAFIPDTMTLRRLPQLWLSVTLLDSLPVTGALGVLARPGGTEFYALTPTFAERLDRPPVFPAAVLVRGAGPDSAATLAKAGNAIGSLLADPKVKEIVATEKGLRIVWQAAEGKRGEHLILRQSAFGTQPIDPAVLVALFDGLETIAAALRPPVPATPRPAGRAARPKARKT